MNYSVLLYFPYFVFLSWEMSVTIRYWGGEGRGGEGRREERGGERRGEERGEGRGGERGREGRGEGRSTQLS